MGEQTSRHFGEYLRSLRLQREVSLREFCRRAGVDPGNASKTERGLLPPPNDLVTLERYASALGVNKGGDEWHLLVDLAAADQGIIPKDLLSDKEVVALLPAVFRTLRGGKPSEEEIDRLVDRLRRP